MEPNHMNATSAVNVPHPCYSFVRIMYASQTAEVN